MQIAIFKPRKDMCDTCVEYNAGNLSEEAWQSHRRDKQKAQDEKVKDKERAKLGDCHVFTMDLQAVKTCPSLLASSLYFKTKLVCHNFTVFDLTTHNSSCYWFDETEADLQASTFASIVVHFIKAKYLDVNDKPIIIYSDGCTYQNRNAIMANALLSLSKDYNITIIQKFLVKGHTQMECDSVHATIEKKIKNKNIEIPNDYYRFTIEARKIQPYEVVRPNRDLFKDFTKYLVYPSIRPGKKTSDAIVTQIRANGALYYSLNFDDLLPHPLRPKHERKKLEEFSQLFKEKLPIIKKKYDHLQEIKTKIDKNYWGFYDALKYE